MIDAVIVSHPHDDHYPGAEEIFRHFQVRSYYDPAYPKAGAAYASFLGRVRQEPGAHIMIGKSEFDSPN